MIAQGTPAEIKNNPQSVTGPYLANKKKIIADAEAKLQEDHLNQWYLEQRSKVQIIDNRKNFYELQMQLKL